LGVGQSLFAEEALLLVTCRQNTLHGRR
jgi:hypothetical protein